MTRDIRTRVPSVLARLLSVVLFLGAGACGGPDAPTAAGGFDDGRPLFPAALRDCAGKPSAGIGHVTALVADRPSADRAVIEATWTRGHRGRGPAVELVLPAAAWLVEGEPVVRLPARGRSGTIRWTVGFETGRDLDAVIRCAAEVEEGSPPCRSETYVRLVTLRDG